MTINFTPRQKWIIRWRLFKEINHDVFCNPALYFLTVVIVVGLYARAAILETRQEVHLIRTALGISDQAEIPVEPSSVGNDPADLPSPWFLPLFGCLGASNIAGQGGGLQFSPAYEITPQRSRTDDRGTAN